MWNCPEALCLSRAQRFPPMSLFICNEYFIPLSLTLIPTGDVTCSQVLIKATRGQLVVPARRLVTHPQPTPAKTPPQPTPAKTPPQKPPQDPPPSPRPVENTRDPMADLRADHVELTNRITRVERPWTWESPTTQPPLSLPPLPSLRPRSPPPSYQPYPLPVVGPYYSEAVCREFTPTPR